MGDIAVDESVGLRREVADLRARLKESEEKVLLLEREVRIWRAGYNRVSGERVRLERELELASGAAVDGGES